MSLPGRGAQRAQVMGREVMVELLAKDRCSLEGLIAIDEPLRRLGIHIAYTVAWQREEIDPRSVEEALSREIERLMDEIKAKYTLEKLREDPVVRAYRDFYWRIGIDPTKTRPSSEALVRRILRGRFPRINPVVDAGNIASARTMVPIGLYDARYYSPPRGWRPAQRI